MITTLFLVIVRIMAQVNTNYTDELIFFTITYVSTININHLSILACNLCSKHNGLKCCSCSRSIVLCVVCAWVDLTSRQIGNIEYYPLWCRRMIAMFNNLSMLTTNKPSLPRMHCPLRGVSIGDRKACWCDDVSIALTRPTLNADKPSATLDP